MCCFFGGDGGCIALFFKEILLHQESGSPGMVSTASGEYTEPAGAWELTWIHCFLIGVLTNWEYKTSNSRLKLRLMKNSLETKEKKKDKKICPNDTKPYVLSFSTSNGLAFGTWVSFLFLFSFFLFFFFSLSVYWFICLFRLTSSSEVKWMGR